MSASGNKPGSGLRKFQPGRSGNPSGRPKDVHGIAALAREKSPQAIDRLLEIGLHGRGTAAVLALREILDRGLGRPQQNVDLTARRGADPTAVGGDPDQARARLEALIAAELPPAGAAKLDEKSGVPAGVAGESGNDVRSLPRVAEDSGQSNGQAMATGDPDEVIR